MKNAIQIAVPKPCHERWDSFTKTSNGGFCASCQKEVIDFTSWSDEQLKLYFKNLSHNSCGRFRQEQLTVYSYDNGKKSPFGWITVFLAGVLLLFTSRQAWAQQNKNPKQDTEQYEPEITIGKVQPEKISAIKVSGVVNSPEEKLTMPGVNVVYKGSSLSTTTDAEGRFSITLENPNPSATLVFSFIGFRTMEYTLNVNQPEQEIMVDMTIEDLAFTGEIVLGGIVDRRWYSPRTWWWRVRSVFGNR